jgi:hypothetical protein
MFVLQLDGLLPAAPPSAVVVPMLNVSVLQVKRRTAPAALAGEGNEAARGRPLWQPYDTAPERNAAELLDRKLEPASRQRH